jgi:hypothetical protein
VLNVLVERWLGFRDTWKVFRVLTTALGKWWRHRTRIVISPMSEAWLREHERQSGHHSDF